MMSSGQLGNAPAPGARVSVRGEEWLVRGSTPVERGGNAIRVLGISELVRNKPAIFIDTIDEVTEVRPEETKFVLDEQPDHEAQERALLFMAATRDRERLIVTAVGRVSRLLG